MNLEQEIKTYSPFNEQEEKDKEFFLKYIKKNKDYLERSNSVGHVTVSIWTVNKERTKTLMVYHTIYDSWAWIGGHADGEEDLRAVALRELEEETGVKHARLVKPDILSLEILTVDGHMKNGAYVSSHLHLNITFLAEAEENEVLKINDLENQAVQWWTFEEAMNVSKEPWFVERIYKKLIERSQ